MVISVCQEFFAIFWFFRGQEKRPSVRKKKRATCPLLARPAGVEPASSTSSQTIAQAKLMFYLKYHGLVLLYSILYIFMFLFFIPYFLQTLHPLQHLTSCHLSGIILLNCPSHYIRTSQGGNSQ